jgi:hypothetical protein
MSYCRPTWATITYCYTIITLSNTRDIDGTIEHADLNDPSQIAAHVTIRHDQEMVSPPGLEPGTY